MADYNTVKANLAKTAARNQTYGKAGKQLLDQKIVPMGPSPTSVTTPQRAPYKSPGAFMRSTDRPDEPITAGMDTGPGVNRIGANIPLYNMRNTVMEEIQATLAMFPDNQDLRDMVDRYGGMDGSG